MYSPAGFVPPLPVLKRKEEKKNDSRRLTPDVVHTIRRISPAKVKDGEDGSSTVELKAPLELTTPNAALATAGAAGAPRAAEQSRKQKQKPRAAPSMALRSTHKRRGKPGARA